MALQETEWPSMPIPNHVRQLLGHFFEVGDSKSDNAGRILSQEIFAPHGQIVVNKRVIDGAEEIATSNHGLLQGLESRRHAIKKVYACNEDGDDLMLIGDVYWTFKNGQGRHAGFAARAVVTGKDKEARLDLYQGWTDLSELMAMLQQQ